MALAGGKESREPINVDCVDMKSRVLGAEESSELPAEDQAPAPRAPSMRKIRVVVESTQK